MEEAKIPYWIVEKKGRACILSLDACLMCLESVTQQLRGTTRKELQWKNADYLSALHNKAASLREVTEFLQGQIARIAAGPTEEGTDGPDIQ